MTQMIDIFEMAADRLYRAQQRLHNARMMQSSPAATKEYELALLELAAAEQDMRRARTVALDLMEDVS